MKRKNSTNITQLQNDYTQTKTVQAYREHKHKKGVKRRITAIAVISGFLIVTLGANIFHDIRQLAQMDTEQAASAAELEKVEKENEELQSQIKKLEDEEYIAKLARSQYYLTKDNEIVFSFPEDNAAVQEEEKAADKADGETEKTKEKSEETEAE